MRAKYRNVIHEIFGIIDNGMNEEQLYKWLRGLGFTSLMIKRKYEKKK